MGGSLINCNYEKSEKDVEVGIKCALGFEINETRIVLDQKLILGEKVEKFLIMPIYTENNNFTCPIGNLTNKDEDLDDKFLVDISFRQVSKFQINKDSNIIMFNFYAVVTQPLQKSMSINMTVKLIKGSELVESSAICISKENVEPVVGEQLQADFECTIGSLDKGRIYLHLYNNNFLYHLFYFCKNYLYRNHHC